MDGREGRTLQAIRLAVSAAECRRAAGEFPQAKRALLRAADSYSAQANAQVQAIAERAERLARRLRQES